MNDNSRQLPLFMLDLYLLPLTSPFGFFLARSKTKQQTPMKYFRGRPNSTRVSSSQMSRYLLHIFAVRYDHHNEHHKERLLEFHRLLDYMWIVTLVIVISSQQTSSTCHSHLLFHLLTPTSKHFEIPDRGQADCSKPAKCVSSIHGHIPSTFLLPTATTVDGTANDHKQHKTSDRKGYNEDFPRN